MIPKIIHFCWFGGAEKPKLAQKCIKSWKKYFKDYQIIEWNESNYDISSAPLYVRQAYETKKWAFVTDYVRLQVVYENGGIYFDTDVEVLKPFDDLLEYSAFFGFESEKSLATGLGFGAEQGSDILRSLMNDYDECAFLRSDGSFDLMPCPLRNKPVFLKYGLQQNNTKQILPDTNILILPRDFFCPYDWETRKLRKTANTMSIHWYDASWWSKKQRRLFFWGRIRNGILWLPKKVLYWILGEEKYEQFKSSIKR